MMNGGFPGLKDARFQIERVYQVPCATDKNSSTPRHIIMKVQNI